MPPSTSTLGVRAQTVGQLLLPQPREGQDPDGHARMDILPTSEVGKPWQSRLLEAGFMLPVPDCICNGI